MSPLAFDTHKAVKALQAAGAAEPLAEAVGKNVATKTDLTEVQVALKADLAEVKAELKTNLAALESLLHHYLWVMAAGIVGLTVALVKLTA